MGSNARALSLIPRERRFYDLFEQQAATIVYSADLLEQAFADLANLPKLARLLAQAVAQLERAIVKLESGKGSEEHIIEVHRLEDAGDSVARHAIAELFRNQQSPLEVIKLKDLYDLLEDALDRCEQVANVLEGIATKNA